MPGIDRFAPTEWFAKAEEDLTAARILLESEHDLYTLTAFHLQQATEKYLKGFLLTKGWALQRIHDLVRLLGDVVVHEPDFVRYDSLCARLTEFYQESRYPIFPYTKLTKEEIQHLLSEVEELTTTLKQSLSL